MSRLSGIALIVLSLALPAGVLNAQWLKEPTKGIPRTADGKPNLAAPAPRTADGKPDLSGLWRFDSGPYGGNVLVDLKPERDPAGRGRALQAAHGRSRQGRSLDVPVPAAGAASAICRARLGAHHPDAEDHRDPL